MNKNNFYKSSECVSLGHPDMVADAISQGVMKHLYETTNDPRLVRAGLEVFVAWRDGKTYVTIGGEIKSDIYNEDNMIDDEILKDIVFKTLSNIGYDKNYSSKFKLNSYMNEGNIIVNNYLNIQASHIALATDTVKTGDQGIYSASACNESPTYEGLPFYLAKKVCKDLYEMAKKSEVYGVDIKTQCTVKYDTKYNPLEISHFVVAIPTSDLRNDYIDTYRNELIDFVKDKLKYYAPYIDFSNCEFFINSTGDWTGSHGAIADSGLTGRKLAVNKCSSFSFDSGGAITNKDATKSDVSACFYCRYIAKNLVASGIVDSAIVSCATSIGQAKLFGIDFELRKGTKKCGEEIDNLKIKLTKFIENEEPLFNDYKLLIEKLSNFGTGELPAPIDEFGVLGNENLPFEKLDNNLIEKFKSLI